MYISEIKLHHFRCYSEDTSLNFTKGINFFVGDNNAGKTTIFHAIEFLLGGNKDDGWSSKGHEGNHDVTIEVTLKDIDVDYLESDNTLKKLKPYLGENNSLIVKRSAKQESYTDSKQSTKTCGIEHLKIRKPNTSSISTFTGIDKAISALFEPIYVWSDLNNDDFQDFSKTKTIGKLLARIINSVTNSPLWDKLQQAHAEAFGPNGLGQELNQLQRDIENRMLQQYGPTNIHFDFEPLEMDAYLKNGHLLVDDHGVSTDISNKGTGMQRAITLSLIEVLADYQQSSSVQPMLFFIDEPETFLHPQAQDRLIQSFKNISKDDQVFITTHSPYLLHSFDALLDKLFIFSRPELGNPIINDSKKLSTLPYSPTWGEINYFAFGVPSPEFHNELFHFLMEANNVNTVSKFDKFLAAKKNVPLADSRHQNVNPHKKNCSSTDSNIKPDITMPTYIRNYIDHPGPSSDPKYCRTKPTISEIRESIEFMLTILPKQKASK